MIEEKPGKDLVLRGDATCTACHDEDSDSPVLSIGKTRHGTVADARTPTCTAVMARVTATGTILRKYLILPEHLERIRPTRLKIEMAPALPVTRADNACTGPVVPIRIGMLPVLPADQIHTGQDKVRDQLAQAEICFTCHKEQRSQINRPSRHPVVREGKVICSDCHNPHR